MYLCLKERWGSSIQKCGCSNPLNGDSSDFLHLKAEYLMDFSNVWHRHPLRKPTLSLLVSCNVQRPMLQGHLLHHFVPCHHNYPCKYQCQKVKCEGHTSICCINLCLFITIFDFFKRRCSLLPKQIFLV